MQQVRPILRSKRLELLPWTVALIDAFTTGDLGEATSALGVTFPEPFRPPPETADVLEFFRSAVEQDSAAGWYSPQMIVRSMDRMAVGSIGLLAPSESGRAMIGYSIYSEFEGMGYASEAAKALVEEGLRRPGITAIFATIPVGHIASETVATRARLVRSGEQIEDEGVTLNVWEQRRV